MKRWGPNDCTKEYFCGNVFFIRFNWRIDYASIYNPISGYVALLGSAFGSMQDIGGVLTQMTPLTHTALGFAVASAAGFFNIGL